MRSHSDPMFSASILLFAALIFLPGSLFAQTGAPLLESGDKYIEDSKNEIEFYSLEELLNVEVDVASLFSEDELVVGSTVSSISSDKWKLMGARRNHEALGNEMSVYTPLAVTGIYCVAVRGYTNSESMQGVATLLDGTPANLTIMGTAFGAMPNFELGILDKIEMIKGPGSAIYGSDAFHGVMLLKTFESEKDTVSAEGAGAYPLYGDGNVKISQGLYHDKIRIDTALSGSYQGDQDLEYQYEEDSGGLGTGERDNKYKSGSGVFKVRVNPNDKIKARLGAYMTYFKCEDYPGPYFAYFNPGHTLLDRDLSSNKDIYLIGTGAVEYSFDKSISFEASGYYSKASLDYYAMASPDFNVNQFGGFNQTGATVTLKQPDNPMNLQWLFAYSFSRCELEDNYYKAGNIKGDFDSKGFTRQINSVFSQLKWGAVKDRFYLLAGGRVDDYADSGTEIKLRDIGTQVSPRGGLIFLPTKDSSIKALYGRAFKAPVQLQLFGFPNIAPGNPNLEPETIDTYELIYIIKTKNFKTSITGYYSYWKNGIVSIVTAEGSTKFINKGENSSYGGELNFIGSLEPFTVELGFSYVMSKAYDTQNPFTLEEVDMKYSTFPEYSAQLGIHYLLKPCNIDFYLNNKLYLEMEDRMADVGRTQKELPPYYRLDFNVSKTIVKNLDLYLNVRNVLNRENRTSAVHGAYNGYVEPGTSVLLRAGYRI